MTTRFVILVVVLLVFLLVVGALLVQQLGGVSIRLTEPTGIQPLLLSPAVVRGIPTTVRWREPLIIPTVMEFVWQTSETDEQSLATVAVHLGMTSVPVAFPCAGAATGRLVMRQVSDRRVVAAAALELLPAHEDCALK